MGHGTLGAAHLIELLHSAGIEALVDIRRYPGSRLHPHHAGDRLASSLPAERMAYHWLVDLGGRRKPDPRSPNTGLRNPQFRAYADHMRTDEFLHGVRILLEVASERRTAVMCSEAVWWRCHRRLLSDHLELLEEAHVQHLFHDGRLTSHPITPVAARDGNGVMYRPEAVE